MNLSSNLTGPSEKPAQRPNKSTARVLWTLFALFVVYGTTFPFTFDLKALSLVEMQRRVNWHPFSSIPDMVQNILLFMPFGFLGYFSLIHKSSWLRKLAIVLLGAGLSLSVEFLQIFSENRWPALADVFTNTAGTAVGLCLGILLKKSVLGFKAHPVSRRFLDAPSAFPALVFLILLVAGIWEPFDFSLDIGGIWNHVKPLLRHPLHFSMPDEDVFASIQFLLASLFLCRVFQEAGWRRPASSGMLVLFCAGIGLEGSQFIIVSRYPEVQDVLVGMLGTTLGAILFHFPGFRDRRWIWSIASILGVFSAATVRSLHPFHFKAVPSHFNWIPFLPQYEATTAAALGNFLANGMVYFPIGFLVGYFFPNARQASRVTLILSGVIALVLEIAQGWVVGRFSDVTSVFGAMLGSLLGSLVLSRGWPAFRSYMSEEEDRQV